jgi:trehalose 6-phosphate phosphatase
VKNILAKAQLATLTQFANDNTLLALNFDGTLAPLVKDPRAARVREATRRSLARVAERYPTVVISGRARADALARLERVPLRAIVGNHGLEPSPDAQRYHGMVNTWLPQLREQLEQLAGVEIENKLYSVTIHYRRAKSRAAALRAIRAAAGTLKDARVVFEQEAVNLLPADAPNKGSTLCALRKQLATERAIYLGDDTTDEDAFTSDAPSRLLGIRVGRSNRSKAPFYLAKQADVDRFLKCLLLLRGAN